MAGAMAFIQGESELNKTSTHVRHEAEAERQWLSLIAKRAARAVRKANTATAAAESKAVALAVAALGKLDSGEVLAKEECSAVDSAVKLYSKQALTALKRAVASNAIQQEIEAKLAEAESARALIAVKHGDLRDRQRISLQTKLVARNTKRAEKVELEKQATDDATRLGIEADSKDAPLLPRVM
jgi:hypothetical protein